MSKKKIAFCENCDCYTEFLYLGKRKRTASEIREKIEEAVFTVGIFPVLECICGTDRREKFWKCTKCEGIFED